MKKKQNISDLDRIILYPAALAIERIYFSYQDVKGLLKEARQKDGLKRLLITVFTVFIFWGILLLDLCPPLENKLYFKIKSFIAWE